jgi:hypothetical protein
MDLPLFQILLSPPGQQALQEACALAPTEAAFLRCITQLEKNFPRDLARAALETVLWRARARTKFRRADQMYFTRESLEQASGEIISTYRAEKLSSFTQIADFGCGIGGDTLSLAQHSRVLAVDLDPVRLAMAGENAKACGVAENVLFQEGDVTRLPFPEVQAVFFDPARRDAGKRYLGVNQYQPPLSVVDTWFPYTRAIGVKIAPGVALAEIQPLDCEAEFISVEGELKECVLWFGPLQTTRRRATILPRRLSMTIVGEPPAPRISGPGRYLHEPDPAVLRAGLVTLLAEQLDAWQLDAEIAYLTSDRPTPTPFARLFQIEEALPFHLKHLRDRLRRLNVGQLVIKKRGSAIDPNALYKQLKLAGTESRILFLTRVSGKPFALICQPC